MEPLEAHTPRFDHAELHSHHRGLALGIGRRRLLQAASLGGAGWLTGLAQLLARDAETDSRGRPNESGAQSRARSVILLWLSGGPSQLETFDPHPGTRIAGGTGDIRTAVAGVRLADGFERLAEQMESIALVRSMESREGDHERGTYLAKTGYRPDPTGVHPSVGAICCHELPRGKTEIPRHISILAGSWPARGGYLGAQYDAFKTGDPAETIPDVTLAVSKEHDERRRRDLDVVERAFRRGRSRAVRSTMHRDTMDAARKMMSSEQLAAFEVAREPLELLARYGDTPFGRGCLAARRLIEVGVRCVEVTLSGWDSHVDNHNIHRRLVRTLDPAFATLIEDLRERELLERTVVLCAGEFGRTPRINSLGGRDHWPRSFSLALAGGGIRGGVVIGETDPEGNPKVKHPKRFADVHATVLATLGIDIEKKYVSMVGRPIRISDGEPIAELLPERV